jgi:hypothetical protein
MDAKQDDKVSDQMTWHWQDLNSWHETVWAMLTNIGVSPAVVDAIRQAPPEYLVGDDLSWLERVIEEIVGESMEIKHELACTLREHFDAIRAFHCARPRDVQSYYQYGIRLLDAAEQNEVIREIFLSGDFPEVTAAQVDEAIQYVGPELRHGRVYFDAHERELVESCGHYMLYGSEYVTAVAAHIQGPRDYRQALKTRGTPTVFVCDVPIAAMHSDALEEFAGSL